MTSAEFDQSLSGFSNPLPGAKAHRMLYAYSRPKMEHGLKVHAEARLSSVLILLYAVNDFMHTVLIQRPAYNGVHGGQVSFPGGKAEPTDRSAEETALREAHEELGIQIEGVKFLAPLTPIYIPPSNSLARPFVAMVETQPHLKPDKREVESVIELPLSHLGDPHSIQRRIVFVPMLNSSIDVPCFVYDERIIWGATAMMLAELRAILFASRI